MSPEHLPAALFTAAILSRRKELDARVRSLIISRVPNFDIHCNSEALEGLACAFQGAGVPQSPRAFTTSTLRDARATAIKWLNSGVFVVARDGLNPPGSALHQVPPVFFAKGDRTLLDLTACAVLNSRKSRKVSPQDHWVNATKELVRSAMEPGKAVVSSYGSLSYSLVSCFAKGFPVILACDDVLPVMDSPTKAEQFLSAYGDLFHPALTLFISSFPPGRVPPHVSRLGERDQVVAALSSVLLVGEVRPGGNMAAILEIARRRKIKVVRLQPEGVSSHNEHETQNIVRSRGGPKNTLQPSGREGDGSKEPRWPVLEELNDKKHYLIHYTRSCPGPWPGQTVAEYCRSLIDAAAGACHTAFDTLQRMLEEKLIRGSHKLTRGSCPVVSLTECPPGELSTIVQWRRGLIRWNFEPYGIAVRKDALIKLGAGRVIYGTEATLRELPKDRQYFFQIQKSGDKDWREEKEWRLPGNLSLTSIGHEDLVVVVPDPQEAIIIQNRFGYRAVSREIGDAGVSQAEEVDGRHKAFGSEHRTSHGV
ncbi:MAG: hypothetical protein HY913_06105 [Desulfomonile tiedjei]|nr:hypothetical protein [Desulfomonile tiedjei]